MERRIDLDSGSLLWDSLMSVSPVCCLSPSKNREHRVFFKSHTYALEQTCSLARTLLPFLSTSAFSLSCGCLSLHSSVAPRFPAPSHILPLLTFQFTLFKLVASHPIPCHIIDGKGFPGRHLSIKVVGGRVTLSTFSPLNPLPDSLWPLDVLQCLNSCPTWASPWLPYSRC